MNNSCRHQRQHPYQQGCPECNQQRGSLGEFQQQQHWQRPDTNAQLHEILFKLNVIIEQLNTLMVSQAHYGKVLEVSKSEGTG